MTTEATARPAEAAGSVFLGGDLRVNRLGYGTMRLTGPGIWGAPADPDEAVRVLRRAIELGVNFIDTADAYGPFVSDELIREALHPYPEELVIATKVGQTRPGPNQWKPLGRPEYLRQQVELSLRYLGLERIDLLQLHRIDPLVPLEEQVGELDLLKQEGKIRHLGLSEVSVEELVRARGVAEIVSVQNLYNLSERQSEAVLEYAEEEGLAFIPWFPIATGVLADPDGTLAAVRTAQGATPAQLALAWLLHRSPALLPIPGTTSVPHLEENVAAAAIQLSEEEFAAVDAVG